MKCVIVELLFIILIIIVIVSVITPQRWRRLWPGDDAQTLHRGQGACADCQWGRLAQAPLDSWGQLLTQGGHPHYHRLPRTMSVWVRKIKLSLRKWRRRESPEASIPPDWQNTLVRKCLQRSSSSVSSFTSSSSSSSSSYSVTDFLNDLATSEELFSEQESGHIKTSTPLSCVTRAWQLAGVKIYDEDTKQKQAKRKSSLKKKMRRFNSDQNLYENGEFLGKIENLYNSEDVDDGYEMILVKNSLNI